MKKIKYIFLLLVLVNINHAQTQIDGIGFYGGLGSIKGNSTSVSSFTFSIFADTRLFFSEAMPVRFSFIYARKLESLLPDGTTSRYYPFQRGVSAKIILEQPLNEYFFLEEGLGPLVLNDRTFSDTNKWGIGFAFHIVGGIDFRNYKQMGFKLSAGTDAGITFNATAPQYFSVHLQTAYYF